MEMQSDMVLTNLCFSLCKHALDIWKQQMAIAKQIRSTVQAVNLDMSETLVRTRYFKSTNNLGPLIGRLSMKSLNHKSKNWWQWTKRLQKYVKRGEGLICPN
jgi:hypothetical protein